MHSPFSLKQIDWRIKDNVSFKHGKRLKNTFEPWHNSRCHLTIFYSFASFFFLLLNLILLRSYEYADISQSISSASSSRRLHESDTQDYPYGAVLIYQRTSTTSISMHELCRHLELYKYKINNKYCKTGLFTHRYHTSVS